MAKRLIAWLLVMILLVTPLTGCFGADEKAPNKILKKDEYQTMKKERTLFSFEEPPELRINGVKAVYEVDKKAYFYSVKDGDAWEYLVPSVEGYEVAYATDFQKGDKLEFLNKNRAVTCMVYNSDNFALLSVYFTTLPVMAIDTETLPQNLRYHDADEDYTVYKDEEGEEIPFDPYAPPSDDLDDPIGVYDTYLRMTLLDPNAKANGYDNGFSTMARAHIRGRSSRKYPKHSYKLELLKEENGVLVEDDHTLLGMRKDGDWNLNGMYAEPTKLRDKVASEVWFAITSDREPVGVNTGYRCEYIELIVNGHYHGLFLMTERIDRKQLELQTGDRLYFSEGDLGKVYQEFLECYIDDMACSGYSLDWPKERTAPYDEWVAFADFVKLVDATNAEAFDKQAPNMIDCGSLADYEIFIQTATAVDNIIQNTFYVARQQADGSYRFEFIPWDFDQTFGNRWHGEMPLLTGEDYDGLSRYNVQFWVSKKMKARNAGGYRDLVKERYNTLRDTVISDKALEKIIDDASAQVVGSGAFDRNKTRWIDGGHQKDPSDLKDYVREHLAYVDTLY